MKSNNPFSLMYGRLPSSIIKRSHEYQEVVDMFGVSKPATLSYMITGIRGSGKTVLLRDICNRFRNDPNWIVIEANPIDEIIGPLSQKLYYEGNKNKLFIDWKLKLNLKFVELEIKKEKLIINDPEIIFENLLEKANKNGIKVLIAIDDVASTNALKKFANFYQAMIGKNYMIYLVMTGLKNNIDALINSDSASFLSRTPKIELKPLDKIEIANEYTKCLSVNFDFAVDLANLTNGYAFAYQVLGYICYENDFNKVNDDLLNKFDNYLRKEGYDVIWKELTDNEKKICFAIAKSENKKVSEIMAMCKLEESNFYNYRTSLIEKDIIEKDGYGKVKFVLPRFEQYILLLERFY